MTHKIQVGVITAIACLAIIAVVIGCSNPQSAAFKGANVADATGRSAMTGWGLYVAAKHPGTNAELQVLGYWNVYKNAELTVLDATAALSTNGNATNLVADAQIAEKAAEADLINTISSITNAVKHP